MKLCKVCFASLLILLLTYCQSGDGELEEQLEFTRKISIGESDTTVNIGFDRISESPTFSFDQDVTANTLQPALINDSTTTNLIINTESSTITLEEDGVYYTWQDQQLVVWIQTASGSDIFVKRRKDDTPPAETKSMGFQLSHPRPARDSMITPLPD